MQTSKRSTVLIVDYALFAHDVAHELSQRGYPIAWLTPSTLSVATFDQACHEHQPTFLFSINYSPELAFLCGQRGLRYVVWTVDPLPLSRLMVMEGTQRDACYLFFHQRAAVTRFQALGFTHTYFLPLAAPQRRQPVMDADALKTYRCALSFVGASMLQEQEAAHQVIQRCGPKSAAVLAQLEGWLTDLVRGPADDVQFSGLMAHPQWVHAGLMNLAPMLQITPEAWLELLDGWLAYLLRRSRVSALAQHQLQVYGDAAWSAVSTQYRGYANHQAQLNLIYAASAVNLDVPRVYQRDIVNMRVFDIMSCGGVVLSEWKDDLATWFTPNEHLVLYKNSDELLAAVERLAGYSPARLQAMGQAARETILESHQLKHRVEVMLNTLD